MIVIRKREKSLHIRLTQQEHTLLMNLCKKCNLRPQTYILNLIRDIQPKEVPPKDFFEVLNSLRQIGNSLRQIALKTNDSGSMDSKLFWKSMEDLNRLISDLKEFMLHPSSEKTP